MNRSRGTAEPPQSWGMVQIALGLAAFLAIVGQAAVL